MPTFHADDSSVDFRLKKNDDANSEADDQESVGNYLQDEQSLLMREQRTKRYSQKYRASTVKRVLENPVIVKQLCRELNVQESDIVSWIAEVVEQKQLRIDQLTGLLSQMRRGLPTFESQTQPAGGKQDSAALPDQETGPVVEGRILHR